MKLATFKPAVPATFFYEQIRFSFYCLLLLIPVVEFMRNCEIGKLFLVIFRLI